MDQELQTWVHEWIAGADDLTGALIALAQSMLLPSRLTQLVVILVVALVSVVIGGMLRRRLDRVRSGGGADTGGAGMSSFAFALLARQVPLLVFVLLTWIAAALFASLFNFPSRRYVLVLVATIATAWLAIRIAATLVRNRFLRQVVIWALSIYATAYYLGLLDEVVTFLDSLAIDFGQFRLSLLAILKALVVTGLLFAGARFLSQLSSTRIRGRRDISPSMQELMIKGLQISLYSAAIFIGLKAVGFDLTGLAVLSGAIGVGLGFGLQKVVSNLVSGVIILLDKSVKPGDVISLGDTFGWISTLGARYVSVVTRDGKEYLIPNEDLITGQVVNWSHTNDLVRLDVHFGTAYSADPHLVRRVAIEATKDAGRVLTTPAPVCHIVGFGDSSVDYILGFWIRDPSAGLTNIRGDVYLALWDAFKEHEIGIPFPQREVRLLNDPVQGGG